MKCRKESLNEHAQRYIRAIMADMLRHEGFVSRGAEDIQWYRIVNQEVIQTIFFYTQHNTLPMFLSIGYGCHPMFLTPEFPKDVYLYTVPTSMETFHPGRPLVVRGCNRICFDDNTHVTCPDDDKLARKILEEILLKLNSIQTPRECYEEHKNNHFLMVPPMTVEQAFSCISPEFMNEVVFWNDIQMHPYCVNRIAVRLDQLATAQLRRKLWRIELKELESLTRLQKVFFDGKRDAHLVYLEQQRQRSINLLKKQLGFEV